MRFAVIFAILIASAASRDALAADIALPTPPHQGDPWIPPRSSLPRFLNTATFDLCAQGLADPRGCEYRRIRIKVGSVWGGDGGWVETGGWVLPPEGGGEPRFAIAWSGLVYPLAGVVGRADLDADARSIGGVAPVNGKVDFNGHGTNNEGASTAVATRLPIRVCLLLRLGRADLAEAVWGKGGKRAAPAAAGGTGPDLNSYGVSYLTLAQDLAWYHFDRAICAHMRGDDALALADARFLDGFTKAVEARAGEMGFPKPAGTGGAPAYIDFLGQLPALLADQERRARERAQPSARPAGEGPEARIADLIRSLDQVAERQWGQPGGVSLGGSPIIEALISEGEAAVEPLIRDFRTENRLTRSVGFHRDFFRNRHILPADQAAYAALTGILKTSEFVERKPNAEPMSRQALADAIEAYWRKNSTVPLAERWYRTLADDAAGERAWLEAAGNITRPENVQIIPGGGPFVVTRTTQPKPGERPRLNGEALRDGHDPTVAALMIRRVDSMLRSPEGPRSDLNAPRQMAAMLGAWDPVAGLSTLKEMTRLSRERFARTDAGSDGSAQYLAASIARFILARDQAGDPEALPEYAVWIRTTSPERLDHETLAVLEPFRVRPDDPALKEAAAWLFGDPASPWVPLIGRPGARPTFHTMQLIASPIMIDMPAFRAAVLAGLGDRTTIGTARIDGKSVSVKLDSGTSLVRSLPIEDPDAAPPGVETPLRRCDFYAWQVAAIEGAPPYNPCWDEGRRDAALKATADFLRNKPKP